MNKNTLIILVAVSVAIAALGANFMLSGELNRRRVEEQLTYNTDVRENLSPRMALASLMSGSFRGVAINFLWQRANNLKQEGKHFEAVDLAEFISELQPRFDQVWVFQSWNMAYNISVATHTDSERWFWVSRGVELIRDKGLRYNPDSVALYRQLSWTFSHKIGQETDEAHRHYKIMLALEWNRLLGTPPRPGLVEQRDLDGQVVLDETGQPIMRLAEIEAFAPIAAMDQRYFAIDEVSRDLRKQLEQVILERAQDLVVRGIAESEDPVIEALRNLAYSRPGVFDRKASRYCEQWAQTEPQIVAKLRAMIEQNKPKLAAEWIDTDQRFIEDFPEATERVGALRLREFKLDSELLRRLGIGTERVAAQNLGFNTPSEEGEISRDAYIDDWLRQTDPAVVRVRDQLILPYLRAKTLRDTYNMSPTFMFELMEGDWMRVADNPLTDRDESQPLPLPIDWRHPGAHGMYWAWRGVWFSRQRMHDSDEFFFELLNVYRMVIHNSQWLAHNGRLTFDPITRYYDWQSDPRMIELYLRLYTGHTDYIGGIYKQSVAAESLGIGLEHFYEWAIDNYWWYGYEREARALYRELQRVFPDSDMQRKRAGMPIEQFVMREFFDDLEEPDLARQKIIGTLYQWLRAAYINNEPELAERRLRQAQLMYRRYMQHWSDTPRMILPPWDQLLTDVCSSYMLSPIGQGDVAAQILSGRYQFWRYAPVELKQAMWDRIHEPLYTMIRRSGAGLNDPSVLFPEPPGMEQWREQNRNRATQGN